MTLSILKNNIMYNLFLDDERRPEFCKDYPGDESLYDTGKWEVVRSYDEFVKKINELGRPDNVSFDYKLRDIKDGLDCAKYLIEKCEQENWVFPDYRVHSSWPGIQSEFFKIICKQQSCF